MRKPVSEVGPDPIDVHVGSRIKGRRIGLRISQTKLGNAIDVTFQQIQKYENGANRVGSSNLYKIAKALDVDVSFFFDGLDDIGAGRRVSGLTRESSTFDGDPMSSRESFELMHNYFRIAEPWVRREMFRLIKALADANKIQ